MSLPVARWSERRVHFLQLVVMVFSACSIQAQQQVPLISITNVWKYNQSGVDLSGAFQRTNYNDVAWTSGRGLLGYETSSPYPYAYPILTPLIVDNTRLTYYFRTHFIFTNDLTAVTLRATNYVDDGAVFYLNGQEVQRLRLPPGPVNATTLAMIANPEGQANVLEFSATNLVQGDNVLAVEVHQSTSLDSDVIFGMSLIAFVPEPGPVRIVTQPANRTVEEGEAASFAADVTGSPPYFFQWFHDANPISNATNSVLAIAAASATDAGAYHFVVSNRFSSATSSNAMLTVAPAPFMLLTTTNTWRYDARGLNLGTVWRTTNYNDSSWPTGRALFYNEDAPLPAAKNTLLPLTNSSGQHITTYYFRARFDWAGSPAQAVLRARTLIDDGAVFYLNGAECGRLGMPAPPSVIAYDTLASRTIDNVDRYSVLSLATSNLVSGQNLLAVEVHQSTSTSPDVVFGLALGTNFALSLPDLVLWGFASFPHATMQTFASSDCEVNEGCAIPGLRRLLQFSTQTRNMGTEDLFLGNPVGNPVFEFDPCHGHYHFNDFASYRLLNMEGALVGLGHKVGFCLLDYEAWDPSANPTSRYNCDNQGIQRGWADIYDSSLPCQWIDITDLPAGDYTLELEIDPENRIQELNESNNVTRLVIHFDDPCTVPPSNDNFALAQLVPSNSATVIGDNECATKQPSEPNHALNSGGRSLWYRWTAPFTGSIVITTEGSSFDTTLAVYRGTALNNLTLIDQDDDSGPGTTSLVTISGTSGTQYYIAVDGYDGVSGNVALSINPSANDNFQNCFAISGGSGSIAGLNSFASREAGEPQHANVPGNKSVWFCWTAPATSWFAFDTFGSRCDTALAIYTGDQLSALTPVASSHMPDTLGDIQGAFYATAGTAYRIAIDSVPFAAGVFQLNWKPTVLPQFISVQSQPNQELNLTISGASGDKYIVQSATNQSAWTDQLRVTNVSGQVTLTDTNATAPQRFYRARVTR